MTTQTSTSTQKEGVSLIFHEKQAAALCGRHALNNLLQGRYVDETYLAEIAAELDERERMLMMSSGVDSVELREFLSQGSGNVDDSGNFSISVLREALVRICLTKPEVKRSLSWNSENDSGSGSGSSGSSNSSSSSAESGTTTTPASPTQQQQLNTNTSTCIELSADPADIRVALEDPEKFEAFVLNLQDHWFTIRRIACLDNSTASSSAAATAAGGGGGGGTTTATATTSTNRWFNLNSTLRAPETISPFFLSAFLAQLKQEGYSIFVVKLPVGPDGKVGTLPPPFLMGSTGDTGRCWHTVDQILASAGTNGKSAAAARKAAKTRAQHSADDDDEFRAALEASMAGMEGGSSSSGGGGSSHKALKGNNSNNKNRSAPNTDDEEEQLRLALAASMEDAQQHKDSSSSSTTTTTAVKANVGAGGASAPSHSWGAGNIMTNKPHTSHHQQGTNANASGSEDSEDADFKEAMRLSMMMDQQSSSSSSSSSITTTGAAAMCVETPLEAIARLRASLPPELPLSTTTVVPGGTSSTTSSSTDIETAGSATASSSSSSSVRILIRLPLALPPHDSVIHGLPDDKSFTKPPGPVSFQRRFQSSERIATLFDFAELCWLESWVVAPASSQTAEAKTPVVEVGVVESGAGGAGGAGEEEGTKEIKKKTPSSFLKCRPYALTLAMPLKTLKREDFIDDEETTLEGVGLVSSAVLSLKPC